jgi:hypothetical protein
MKTLWLIIIFIPFIVFAQNDNIYERDIVDEGKILQNFNIPADYQALCDAAALKLYKFSDYIYNPILLKRLDSLGSKPQWIESSTRVSGAWGRGNFTKLVDSYLFSKIDTDKTNYKSLWVGEGNSTKFYRQVNPDLSYCSKALLFTIYWCKSHTNSVKDINKIRSALAFFIRNQKPDGGFIQYWFRTSQTDPSPDSILNRETPYATADVLRALIEGYFFFKDNIKIKNNTFLADLKKCIVRSGDYLMSAQCKTEEGNNNYKCFSIWGLASAYKITDNKALLDSAVTKYYEIRISQNADGAWYMDEPDPVILGKTIQVFHDTHPCYMGIILRGLGELYSALPNDYPGKGGNSYAKVDIKKSICLTVNNFLRIGLRKNSMEPRLNPNGTIWPYKSETEYVGASFYGLNLIHGLIYLENCNDALKLNPDLLTRFIKVLMIAHLNQINSAYFAVEPNHDDDMVSLGLELVPNQLSTIYKLSANSNK